MIQRPIHVDEDKGIIYDASGKKVCFAHFEPGHVAEQIEDLQEICDAVNKQEIED